MERYWQIEKVNLKYNIPLHAAVCLLVLLVSPLLLGVENLGEQDSAKVLEIYVALIGIVLIPPVFLPEQDHDIRDLVFTKYIDSRIVYLIRLVGNLLLLALMLGIYIGMLRHNECEFPAGKYFCGTLAEMLFLGGLGLFFYGLSDNLVIGYMVPIVYYITAFGSGSKYLQMFYPFSMARGSYHEKVWLLAAGALLVSAGIWIRCKKR